MRQNAEAIKEKADGLDRLLEGSGFRFVKSTLNVGASNKFPDLVLTREKYLDATKWKMEAVKREHDRGGVKAGAAQAVKPFSTITSQMKSMRIDNNSLAWPESSETMSERSYNSLYDHYPSDISSAATSATITNTVGLIYSPSLCFMR